MIALICFVPAVLVSPFKSKNRLKAKNGALRHQLIVLRRRIPGRSLSAREANSSLSLSWHGRSWAALRVWTDQQSEHASEVIVEDSVGVAIIVLASPVRLAARRVRR